MTLTARGRLRRLWFNVHLWIGVALAVLLIPLGLTGSVLVWDDALLAAGPGQAISGPPAPALPPSAYLAAAQDALAGEARPAAVRFPERSGQPVSVLARGRPAPPAPGARPGRPPQVTVNLNPADARVLSVSRGRPGWWMTVHGFHENLLVRGWGRAVVGWLGVAMLISSLTGIWLWWPRSGAVAKGFRFRRTPGFWLNVHHMAGFWISLPLAFVSLTGIGLGFPQQTRALISLVAPVSAPRPEGGRPDGAPRGALRGAAMASGERGQGGRGGASHGEGGDRWRPSLGPDEALARSGVAAKDLRVLTLATRETPVWKVERREGAPVEVADANGAVRPAAAPLGGDVAWRWLHRLHGGGELPLVWRLIVTLCGFAPTLLGITGIAVWIGRTRRRRASSAAAA